MQKRSVTLRTERKKNCCIAAVSYCNLGFCHCVLWLDLCTLTCGSPVYMPKADYFMQGLKQLRVPPSGQYGIASCDKCINKPLAWLSCCSRPTASLCQRSLRKVVSDSEATSSYALGPFESPRAVQLVAFHCSSGFVLVSISTLRS